MVKHIAMWTFKDGVDKAATVAKLQEIFAGFPGKVPGLLEISVHGGYQGYDAVLESLHEDAAALEVYQNHPVHLEAKAFVTSVRDQRAGCDYEIG